MWWMIRISRDYTAEEPLLGSGSIILFEGPTIEPRKHFRRASAEAQINDSDPFVNEELVTITI